MSEPSLRRDGARLNSHGYANILRAVQIQPSTPDGIATVVETAARTVSTTLWRLADLGLIHEIDWVPNLHNKGRRVPVYAFGPGVRAEPPSPYYKHAVSKWTRKSELLAFSFVIHAMIEGPQGTVDLSSLSGYAQRTVRLLIAHCRSIKLARLAEWETRASRAPVALWAIGSEPDARRPRRMSNTEICRRYTKRMAALRPVHTVAATMMAWSEPVRIAEAA